MPDTDASVSAVSCLAKVTFTCQFVGIKGIRLTADTSEELLSFNVTVRICTLILTGSCMHHTKHLLGNLYAPHSPPSCCPVLYPSRRYQGQNVTVNFTSLSPNQNLVPQEKLHCEKFFYFLFFFGQTSEASRPKNTREHRMIYS